mgnify:CR=1 FL=1
MLVIVERYHRFALRTFASGAEVGTTGCGEGVVAVLSYLGLALILSLMLFVFGLDLGLIPRR